MTFKKADVPLAALDHGGSPWLRGEAEDGEEGRGQEQEQEGDHRGSTGLA